MPNLSSLGIGNFIVIEERNKVKSLKCMRKAYIQNFRHFGIAGNKILDCEEITRLQSTSLSMIGI